MINGQQPKTKTFVLSQIRRLKSKPFYPASETDESGKRSNPGELELARTLYKYCISDAHAERVIDAAVIRRFGIGQEDRCPSPSDLWEVCSEIGEAPTETQARTNPDCDLCRGSGFTITEIEDGITGASKCQNGCGVPVAAGDLRFRRVRLDDDRAAREERRMRFLATRRTGTAPRITDADIARLSSRQRRKPLSRPSPDSLAHEH